MLTIHQDRHWTLWRVLLDGSVPQVVLVLLQTSDFLFLNSVIQASKQQHTWFHVVNLLLTDVIIFQQYFQKKIISKGHCPIFIKEKRELSEFSYLRHHVMSPYVLLCWESKNQLQGRTSVAACFNLYTASSKTFRSTKFEKASSCRH